MEIHFENIENEENIPIKIFTQTVEKFSYHWHEEMEIIFVLSGKIKVFIEKEETLLSESDVFLINKNEVHYIKANDISENSQLLVLQVNLDYLNKYKIDLSRSRFKLNISSGAVWEKEALNSIRSLLAKMMKTVLKNENSTLMLIEKNLIELMLVLINNFNIGSSPEYKKYVVSEERLIQIIKYINDNYKDTNLSLKDISENFFLNPQYISRYFKSNMGISIKRFIDNLRLNKSLKVLRYTNERIIDIAEKFGFADEKSYYRVFKEVVGVTPTKYRDIEYKDEKSNARSYFDINNSETLEKLFKYIEIKNENNISREKRVENSNYTKTDIKIKSDEKVLRKFSKNFKSLLTFGDGRLLLREDFLNQLSEIQKDIGFKYARFHGIFSDDLSFYNERCDGTPFYNYTNIDIILDNLLKNNLKPFIELGFMPELLSSIEGNLFVYQSNVSPPKDINKWLDLLQNFFIHIINRYGEEEIQSWYFEFWNEPNIKEIFWKGTDEEFFEFYKRSREIIKNINKNIKLGGFGVILFESKNDFNEKFSKYSIENDVSIDFYTFHVYQNSFTSKSKAEIDKNALNSVIKNNNPIFMLKNKEGIKLGDKDEINKAIDKFLEIHKNINKTSNEVFITEWNSTINSRDLIHDTLYMAPFICKTLLQNSEKVNGMGFWTFTDIFEEFKLEKSLFHGGFGLVTENGIKKPSYRAFEFLNKLYEEVIYEDESVIITRENENFSILLYNYCHFNELYNNMDYSEISDTDRYNVFENGENKVFEIEIEIPKGNYIIQKIFVNRNEGSAFDEWVKIGAPKNISKIEHEKLKSVFPGYKTEEVIVNEKIQIKSNINVHEMELIQIRKIH